MTHQEKKESLSMKFKNKFTRRLNLNISPQTYAKIEKEAIKEGRKAGNYARRLLDRWAKDEKAIGNDRREKIMGQ